MEIFNLLAEPQNDLQGGVLQVLGYIFGVVALVFGVFVIYLGFLLAKAEDEGKRREAKDRMVKMIVTLLIISVLTGMLFTIDFLAGSQEITAPDGPDIGNGGYIPGGGGGGHVPGQPPPGHGGAGPDVPPGGNHEQVAGFRWPLATRSNNRYDHFGLSRDNGARHHLGIDMPNGERFGGRNQNFYAVADGYIVSTGNHPSIKIRHDGPFVVGGTTFETLWSAHLIYDSQARLHRTSGSVSCRVSRDSSTA